MPPGIADMTLEHVLCTGIILLADSVDKLAMLAEDRLATSQSNRNTIADRSHYLAVLFPQIEGDTIEMILVHPFVKSVVQLRMSGLVRKIERLDFVLDCFEFCQIFLARRLHEVPNQIRLEQVANIGHVPHQRREAGGTLVVSPDTRGAVIRATKNAGMASYPGVMTATECFKALRNGADGLKFFPASLIGPNGLSALRAVLPPGTKTYAVGGAGATSFQAWFEAGVTGFGVGSELYRAGSSPLFVSESARKLVASYDRCLRG